MDHSGINFTLVKECISFLAIPISHIANISFAMGIFPNRKLIPIFKSRRKDYFTNYSTQFLEILDFFKKSVGCMSF